MIPRLDSVVDLGRDQKRMSDEDPRRQPASVNKLLETFFGEPPSRTEIQLLADEVGMGKTFVALATAYAVLDVMRHKPTDEQPLSLRKCYRAVVVVTPKGNYPLMEKWHREVEAFRTRCSRNAVEHCGCNFVPCRKLPVLARRLKDWYPVPPHRGNKML